MAWVDDDNASLLTDLYELTMAAAYLQDGFDHEVTFELWVRGLPPQRRFMVVAGLDTALTYLERLRFTPEALRYLDSERTFSADFLDYLADFGFAGTVHAMPEGTIAYPSEPLMRVTAPVIHAQLVETFLLNALGFQTMIASKAARMYLAARGRRFVDFGSRRAHGADAALKAARASYIGGAVASSLVLAGTAYGIPITGTMAHSFVLAHPDEESAFRSFARTFADDDIVFLIDTYDTVAGARIAAKVITDLASEDITVRAVRLDSGDLGDLAVRVRQVLDDAGHTEVGIIASSGLDEHEVARLVDGGAPIDGFGIGTSMVTSDDAPSLDIVYKLVDDRGTPRYKASLGKVTLPGIKQVFRGPDGDVLALADETFDGHVPLLQPAMVAGERVAAAPPLAEIRQRALDAIDALPNEATSLEPRTVDDWPVTVSSSLQRLADSTVPPN
ncbi:MAG: nicotinate phosphoribosyltransferase [Acidimicrobiia bacterium]